MGFRFHKLIVRVRNFNKKHLTLVNAVQAGVLLGASDILAQKLVEKKKNYDYRRTLNFIGIGTFFIGPYSSIYFQFVSRVFLKKDSRSVSVLVQKLALDQLIFAPSLVAAVLFSVNTLNGKNNEEIQMEFEDKYVEIMKTNYLIWPFIKLYKYYSVPVQHQVLYSQGFAFFWNIYICWKMNSERKHTIQNSL